MCSSQINISDQTDSSGSNVTFLKMQIGNTASHQQGDRGHRAGRGDRRSGRRGQRARRPWSAGLTARRRFSPCVVEPPGRAWGTTATTCVSRRRILPPTGRASPGTPLGGRGSCRGRYTETCRGPRRVIDILALTIRAIEHIHLR